MNSTLQCLLHNFELMKHMQHVPSSDENGISTGIAHYFSKLLKKYWSGEFSVVVPDEFKQQLAKIHSQFDGNGQHDGQELLALFLESLHQERKTMIKSNVSSTEETSKRKRTKSVESVDDGLPNNKRIEINIASSPKQVLTINSFFGKEKKTANVNVLSSEVECDEETTTDHSTKYPQHICSRLNNGQFLGEAEMTAPLP
uniref:ubiquitinyl hydrolase 1 n=1 Tax=Ciona savignyi TaxID=51511 RepID=H2ZJG6_CIOSA